MVLLPTKRQYAHICSCMLSVGPNLTLSPFLLACWYSRTRELHGSDVMFQASMRIWCVCSDLGISFPKVELKSGIGGRPCDKRRLDWMDWKDWKVMDANSNPTARGEGVPRW